MPSSSEPSPIAEVATVERNWRTDGISIAFSLENERMMSENQWLEDVVTYCNSPFFGEDTLVFRGCILVKF